MHKHSKIEFAYYTPNLRADEDVIEGVARGGQLVVMAGSFNVGKSPLLQDLAVSLVHGIPWCGRQVKKRPVVYFDLENPDWSIRINTMAICNRKGVEFPTVPDELEPYNLHGTHPESGCDALASLMQLKSGIDAISFIEEILSRKPNSVVMIDPAEMLFKIDTIRKVPVLELFGRLRGLLTRFPEAIIILTFNLRKQDPGRDKPDLLRDPRTWLEEVCGTLDLINRSDIRLGMDYTDEERDQRVINGVRRGEAFDPILVKPVELKGELAGFEICSHKEADLLASLTKKQKAYWAQLPEWFMFEDVADGLVPRASLWRLLKRLKSLGLVEEVDGLWRKTAHVQLKFAKLPGEE